jgi:hypothetical protein
MLLYSSCQVKLPISTQRFHVHCVFNDQISSREHEIVFFDGGMQPSISYDYFDNFQKASSGFTFGNISNFNHILTNNPNNVCLVLIVFPFDFLMFFLLFKIMFCHNFGNQLFVINDKELKRSFL